MTCEERLRRVTKTLKWLQKELSHMIWWYSGEGPTGAHNPDLVEEAESLLRAVEKALGTLGNLENVRRVRV